VHQLPQRAIDCVDACLQIVDAADERRAGGGGGQNVFKLAAEQVEVSGEDGNVLDRPVVKIEAESREQPFASLDERSLAGSATDEQRLAL
jgi:hypothetical protein